MLFPRRLGLVLVGVSLYFAACSRDNPPTSIPLKDAEEPPPKTPTRGIEIGPIPGWTTGWHFLDETLTLAVPRGSLIQLRCPLMGGDVTWQGIERSWHDQGYSYAICPTAIPGSVEIYANVVDGDPLPEKAIRGTYCRFNVLDVDLNAVRLDDARITEESWALDNFSTNQETMNVFFGQGSVSHVLKVGQDQYHTSTGKELFLLANLNVASLSPLIEWRIDGQPVRLGSRVRETLNGPGVHIISVGPPSLHRDLRIEAYSVRIINPPHGEAIPLDEPVTLRAVSEPPGFESEIVWVASTKYGRVYPVQGFGPEFTVHFSEVSLNGFQWMGVRAGNAILEIDGSVISTCLAGCGAPDTSEYDPNIAINSDLHIWDVKCKAGGHKNLGELIHAICAKRDSLGRQISVFVDGHGCPGTMSTGSGSEGGNDSKSDSATFVSVNNAGWLRDRLKDKVTTITLFGCKVGASQAFLDSLGTNGLRAEAYDKGTCTNAALTVHRPKKGATKKGSGTP